MKKALLPLAFALAVVVAPVSAQSVDLSIPGSWTQTWFGCDPGRACFWVQIWDAPNYPDVDVCCLGGLHFRTWYFFDWGDTAFFHRFGDEIGGPAIGGYFVEGSHAYDWYDDGIPEHMGAYSFYYGEQYPYGVDVRVTGLDKIAQQRYVTPEPASLIFIGTGLLGLAGAHRRRRKTSRST